MTQRRPAGPSWVVDQAWKDEVKLRLAANRTAGVQPASVAQLARLVGVTPPALSEMLRKPGRSSTRLLPAVNAALGMELPTAHTAVDKNKAYVNAMWGDLTPEDHETVRLLVERLAARK